VPGARFDPYGPQPPFGEGGKDDFGHPSLHPDVLQFPPTGRGRGAGRGRPGGGFGGGGGFGFL